MKKQTTDSSENISNVQKTFLEKFIEHLPSMETTNALTNFSKIETSSIEKIFQRLTQCDYVRSTGGGGGELTAVSSHSEALAEESCFRILACIVGEYASLTRQDTRKVYALLRMTRGHVVPSNHIKTCNINKNCYNSDMEYHISYGVFMKSKNISSHYDESKQFFSLECPRKFRDKVRERNFGVACEKVSRFSARGFESESAKARFEVCESFTRPSEQSEESILKSVINDKDSSVTSFPQNDDCVFRHSNEGTQYLTLQPNDGHPEHSSAKESKIIRHYEQTCLRSNRNTLTRLPRRFAPRNDSNFAFTLAEAATQVGMPNKFRKTAFTLAEVLITLGIIGVVAAMTLPSLIVSYKKQETVSKVKKTYSVLNQAYKQAQLDNGEPINWDDPFTIGIEKYFQTYWYPYLQINKICRRYEDCGYTKAFPWSYSDRSRYDLAIVAENARRVVVLPDGILVQIVVTIGDSTLPEYMVNIDINGAGKPNILGRDVFEFTWDGISGIVAKGYNSPPETIDYNCKTKGVNCAAKMIKDGWEIKADYPFK